MLSYATSGQCSFELLASSRHEELAIEVLQTHFFLTPHAMIVFNIVTCSLQSKPTLTQVTLLEAIYQTQLPLESQKALYIYKITLTKTCKQTFMCKIGGVPL